MPASNTSRVTSNRAFRGGKSSSSSTTVPATGRASGQRSTWTMKAYEDFKKKNPRARMVCLDIQPYATVQAPPRADILHVGGFSDQVFRVVRSFAAVGNDPDHWSKIIERTAL